jgi:hypothetical protein
MKRLMLAGLIVSMIQVMPARAAEHSAPLLGSWALDVTHSQIPPEARPKSVVITYKDVGAGTWSTDVAIVGSDDTKINATGSYLLDGTPAPSTGYMNVDTVAAKSPTPNVLVMAFYKEGMPRTTRTYIVASDGKTMSETIVWLNINGKPEITTNTFNRVE